MKYVLNILCMILALHCVAQDGELSQARNLFDEGQYEAVIEHLHSFEIRYGNDLLLEADAYHKLKEYEMAIQVYDQVQTRDKDNLYAYMRRGAAYLEMGNFEMAVKDLKKAMKISEENPELNFYMGNLCYDQGDMKNATKHYDIALKGKPNMSKALYMKAAVMSELGNYKAAKKAFTQVLDQFPNAAYNLGVVYLEQGEHTQAIQQFSTALDKGYDSPDLHFFMAEAHFYMNDKHAACSEYKIAAAMGDEESAEIFDQYCLKNNKKAKRKRRDTVHISL